MYHLFLFFFNSSYNMYNEFSAIYTHAKTRFDSLQIIYMQYNIDKQAQGHFQGINCWQNS